MMINVMKVVCEMLVLKIQCSDGVCFSDERERERAVRGCVVL